MEQESNEILSEEDLLFGENNLNFSENLQKKENSTKTTENKQKTNGTKIEDPLKNSIENQKMDNSLTGEEQEELENFVNTIYQNVSTGLSSINEIEKLTNNEKFLNELNREKAGYTKFKNQILEFCTKNNITPSDNNIFEKARLFTSIKLTTLFDRTTRHLAEMMLIGTVMGTLTCYKDLTDYKNINAELYTILTDVIGFEEDNFNKLKGFLKE